MEEGRSIFKILTGKSAGKRPLGRPMRIDERIILQWILKKLCLGENHAPMGRFKLELNWNYVPIYRRSIQ